LAGIALYLVYLAIALVILTQGKSKNLIMKILGGLSGLYFGITGYISDILSYSRLLALGLATGIIGMVINIIGTMLNEMIPYVGWLLMIFVLIGGHIFNLIISLVGAFIHSGRLQYVEFFKTFFEGGGKQFAPFMRESKYINLIKK
jgi:V/A-type H+-transporting ATPase subunit I